MTPPKDPFKGGRKKAGKKVTAARLAKEAAERATIKKAISEGVQLAIPLPGPAKLKLAGKAIKAVVKGKKVAKATPPGMAKHYADQARAILAEPNPAKRKKMSRNIKPFVPTIPKLNKTRKKRSK